MEFVSTPVGLNTSSEVTVFGRVHFHNIWRPALITFQSTKGRKIYPNDLKFYFETEHVKHKENTPYPNQS